MLHDVPPGPTRPGADDEAASDDTQAALVRAMDRLADGLVVVRGRRVLSANDAFCEIVGRGRDELLEMDSVVDLFVADQRADVGDRLERALRGDVSTDRLETAILVGRSASGASLRVDVELAIERVGPGGPDTTFVAVIRDVTRVRREARSARILAEASDLVAAGADEAAATAAMVRLLVPGFSDWAVFDRHDVDGSLVRVAVAHIEPAGEALLWDLDRQFPVRQFEGNLRARVLRTQTPLVMNAVTESTIRATARNHEHARMLREVGMSSAMWVPAVSIGRTFGVLSVGRAAVDRPFDAADLDLASKLGHRAAQVVERAATDRAARSRERQQAAVAEVGRLALAGLDLAALQQRAVNLIAETLDVEYAASLELLPDEAGFRIVAGVGWTPGTMLNPDATISLADASMASYTLRSGGPVLTEDVRTETRFAIPAFVLANGIVSGMSVVIASHRDEPHGILSVHATSRRRFGGEDVSFVSAVANVLATAIDRREAELALRETDDRLHLALAASQTGTWEWDLGTGSLHWSDEILRLHGLPPGHPAPSFDEYLAMIHPEDRELFQRTVGAALSGTAYDLDYRVVPADGSVRWTNGQGRVFLDANGDPVRMVGVGRDITERKQTEAERDQLLEQERTARQLREAFIGVLSHELRTPITTILGGARLLADRGPTLAPDMAAGLLADIEQESERLARLIEDLLVLSRSERGNVDRREDPVLPSKVLETVVLSSGQALQRVSIDSRVPRNLPIVLGDETYLEQILRNLIGNAAKFSPPGSTVAVESDVTPSEVVLRILDQGPGIEPDETEQLFDVFYRSPRTRSKASGSGIGLFVARQLASAMGGRIWARPRPEGGAEFGIALRRYEVPPEDRADDPGSEWESETDLP
jgi:PAS domain S-box-containing protein